MSYWKRSRIGDLLNTTPIRTWLSTIHWKTYSPAIHTAAWYRPKYASLRKKLNTMWADITTFGEFVVDESINFLIPNYRKRCILARLGAMWRLIARNTSQFDAANHIWQQPTFQGLRSLQPWIHNDDDNFLTAQIHKQLERSTSDMRKTENVDSWN
jgi:hypothetical protein